MPRRVLGLASDDPHLQALIPYVSTAESRRLGEFSPAKAGKRPNAKQSELLEFPVSLAEMEIDRLQQSGNQAFKQQELPRAIRLWSDALSKVAEIDEPAPKKLQASRKAQLYANRCQAQLASGDEEAALADAEAAVEAAPGWPKAYYRYGTVLMRCKHYSRACEVFEQGCQLDPSNSELVKSREKAREAARSHESRDAVEPTAAPSPTRSASSTPETVSADAAVDGAVDATDPAAAADANVPPPEASVPLEKAGKGGAKASAPPASPTVPALPVPEHELGPHPEEGTDGYLLCVHVPKVNGSKALDLCVNNKSVELEAPGVYSQLRVPLPREVDADHAIARFDKQASTLKITLPFTKAAA